MRYPVVFSLPAQSGDETSRIQEAIDETARRGGGSVVLEGGCHMAGGLRLASGVDLVLGEEAVLVASSRYEDYAGNIVSVKAEDSDRAFIHVCGVDGAGIFGPGWIDGVSDAWNRGFDEGVGTLIPAELRPRLVVVEQSTNITLAGFGIRNAPMWTVHLISSRTLTVSELSIENDIRLPNNDGIVIDGCVDVMVSHCRIDTADDGVCLKTSRKTSGETVGACRNVQIEHCQVASRSCAFKIGTESHDDISDVAFVDCVADRSNRGLGVVSRDGGRINRIRFERIRLDCHETPVGFWGSGEPINISALDRRSSQPAGAISDVVIKSLDVQAEGAAVLYAEQPGMVSNVVLENIILAQRPGPLGTGRMLDLRPTTAELVIPDGAEGRANSWVRLADGSIAGLTPYPGGFPAVFAYGVEGLHMRSVTIDRPDPLPEDWNRDAIVR